jgi:ElaB/YqjD/DUF883 family membrane-anchored ribosome-binding protein
VSADDDIFYFDPEATDMFGTMRNDRAFAREISEIEHLLRQLETRVGRMTNAGSRAAANGATQFIDTVSNTLGYICDRFRDRFRDSGSMTDTATKMSRNALHRVTHEVEHHPLLTLAVAVGVGFLAGMAGRRD